MDRLGFLGPGVLGSAIVPHLIEARYGEVALRAAHRPGQ